MNRMYPLFLLGWMTASVLSSGENKLTRVLASSRWISHLATLPVCDFIVAGILYNELSHLNPMYSILMDVQDDMFNLIMRCTSNNVILPPFSLQSAVHLALFGEFPRQIGVGVVYTFDPD